MAEEKNDKETKKTKPKTNTMDITLINSAGKKFSAKGPCTDREFKAICKAVNRTPDQDIKVTDAK